MIAIYLDTLSNEDAVKMREKIFFILNDINDIFVAINVVGNLD